MKSTGLESAQWSELPKDMPILFYDRRDATRRIWNNSMEVKNLLEKEYHASVRLIGKEWKKLKFPEQTALYNAYPVIVAPHGAHLANLMFAREGTKVIELVCSEGGSCPRNSEAWTPSNNAYNWFPPFTRKIPLDHFQIPEFEGCLEDGKRLGYSPKSFSVNITTFLPCLASHLGLSPRSDAKLPRPRI
jgi:Glycosyltransferase 61